MYKAIVNIKDGDEVIFKAGDIYEGELVDDILIIQGEGNFEYEFISEELKSNFIKVS